MLLAAVSSRTLKKGNNKKVEFSHAGYNNIINVIIHSYTSDSYLLVYHVETVTLGFTAT